MSIIVQYKIHDDDSLFSLSCNLVLFPPYCNCASQLGNLGFIRACASQCLLCYCATVPMCHSATVLMCQCASSPCAMLLEHTLPAAQCLTHRVSSSKVSYNKVSLHRQSVVQPAGTKESLPSTTYTLQCTHTHTLIQHN